MRKTIAKSAPGQRLRAAREALGLSCEAAGARVRPPISGQSWGDAERGRPRSLDWWYSAARPGAAAAAAISTGLLGWRR
jgi:hypothetical protein